MTLYTDARDWKCYRRGFYIGLLVGATLVLMVFA